MHYGLRNKENYERKVIRYAIAGAKKLFNNRTRVSFLKKYGSALFNTSKSYIFQLGFLDGRNGWIVAKGIGKLSFLKYKQLERFHERNEKFEVGENEIELIEPAII